MTLAYQNCNCYEEIMKIQTSDIKIQAAKEKINVRVYMPEKAEKCPVMIFYHGGAFSMNSIDAVSYTHLERRKGGWATRCNADYISALGVN